MKKIILSFLSIIAVIVAQAQTPQLINYQAVARDNAGVPLANQSLGLRLSILDGSPTGAVLYQETQTAPSNQFGLFTLQIGGGTVVSGTFSGIHWGVNSKYIKVEMDPTGGTNYTVVGANQLVSVPYALMAANNWGLSGNAGTTAANNFIGTTDNEPLIFKVAGYQAGRIDYSVSSANTSFGNVALIDNTTGQYNTAIGYEALITNSTGSSNTATGFGALQSNTTGYNNTGMGDYALEYNTIGYDNVAIGFSLSGNTTGYSNTATGNSALINNTTGNYNTGLGYNAGVSTGALNNAMALGYNASVTASNKIAIGNTSITSIQGQVAFTTFSDARVKNNVQANVPGLAFITALRPVTYHYDIKKENELLGIKNDTTNWAGKYDIEKMTFSGFIAQEVDATAKQIGYDFSGVDKSGALLGIRYSDFVPSLVKAAQELNEQNIALKQQVQTMQQQLTALQQQVQQLIQAGGK